jgi:hypothetical protein
MQGTLTFVPPLQGEGDEEEKPPDSFVGTMVEGVRHGQGKYTWSNGCWYGGPYVDGFKHGDGTLTFPDGSKYKGATYA